jgi:ABC-type transporter Mla subunit MlaD
VNNDFVNQALESAKALQQTVTEAIAKGTEQAKPLVADAVNRAIDLQKTLIERAPSVAEAAQTQLTAAQGHLTTFIATGKDVLGKSVEGAQAGLAPIADNARQAIHQAARAVSEATAPKPPAPPGA